MNALYMIRKLNPNRTIGGGGRLNKEDYQLLLNNNLLKLRAYSTDELCRITRDYLPSMWTKAAQIVIDERIAGVAKIKPDKT